MFNWCFIGAGTLAKSVAKEITASGRHKIVSVYQRNEEKCKEFAKEYDALPCKTAKDAMSAEGVDGIYIVTPHSSHYEYVKLAIDLNKPVLCEKPFTVTKSEAEDLFKLAKEKNVYVTEAMWTFYAAPARKVLEWKNAGEFGDIKKVKLSYIMNAYKYAPRLTDPLVAGGALLDIGVYPLTYIYRLFGMPDKIKCRGKIKNGVDYHEKIKLYYGERVFSASVSMKDPRVKEDCLIEGTKARMFTHHFHVTDNVTLVKRDGSKEQFNGPSSMLNEFDLVAGEIKEGLIESPLVPHEATVNVMGIMDECRKQMGLKYPFEK
jgi:predicted dehydrogenase